VVSDVPEFERVNRDGLRTLILRGEFDLASRDEFRVQMARLVIGAHSPVVVDLSRVTFLDSAGLGVLVGTEKNAADAGVEIILDSPQVGVRQVLEITGLDTVFEIRDHPSGLSDATTG
jgi:anti-sigma B factor antagonist